MIKTLLVLLTASVVLLTSALLFAQDAQLEYAFYSQFLATQFTPASANTMKIVSHTADYVLPEGAANKRCFTTFPHVLVMRFNDLNKMKYSVADRFSFPQGIKHAMTDDEKGLKLSRIAFNDAKDECLLYVDDNRNGLPSLRHGRLFYLKREGATWKAVNRCTLW
ncbi:MAG TPA: hypothetical protein VK564_08665 [Thermodesulfobacteriota bacterium]|nr:hypothetical protein [Thermodesulfobacteriota bacterium]